MLTRFFRQDNPLAYLPLPLLVLALWPGAGTGGAGMLTVAPRLDARMVAGMPFFRPVRWLMELSPWLPPLIGVAIVFALAHAAVRLGNDAELYDRRNHLGVALLPLLLALLPYGLAPDAAMVGALPLTWSLGRVWRSVGRQQAGSALFDAGSLLGLAGLFYLPYTFLIVVVWATLAVTRPFHLREYVLPSVGMAVLLFLGWGVLHFAAPGLWKPVASLHFPSGMPPLPEGHWMYRVVLVAVLGVLGAGVAVTFAAVYARSVTREKNIRAAFLAFAFAMGLLALFAWWLDRRIPPVLAALPGAMLLVYPLMRANWGKWADAAVVSLLLLACWVRWAG